MLRTEARNPKSDNFSEISVSEMITTLSEIELQMFGDIGINGLYALEDQIIVVIKRIKTFFEDDPNGKIILSGSGTSGRLCHVASILLEKVGITKFKSNVNGGLTAFFKSRAGVEDDYFRGISEIQDLSKQSNHYGLIGVSCGLSAPYIAGQLTEAARHFRGPVVALGFNDPKDARREVRVQGSKSFSSVLQDNKIYTLAPDVGAEAIAGSVRLKCGTSTLIILYILGLLSEGSPSITDEDLRKTYRNTLDSIEQTLRKFYTKNSNKLEEIVGMAVETIKQDGACHFYGSGIAGLMSVIDSAECPPTFGASYDDFIGYCDPEVVCQDQHVLPLGDMELVPRAGELFCNNLKEISSKDVVINICATESVPDVRLSLRDNATNQPYYYKANLEFVKNNDPLMEAFLHTLQVKAALNTISTSTFSMTGKVYMNVMIDLRISNAKLFDRAISIISSLCMISSDEARQLLIQAIYGKYSSMNEENEIIKHVEAASSRSQVVPLAILMNFVGKDHQEYIELRLGKKDSIKHIIQQNISLVGNNGF